MYNHALDTFVRAAELGSFSKAAEEFYISPSAVIQQINHLEADLNVRLFNRSKKGVTLTPAGEYLLLESKSLILRSHDIRSHLSAYSEHAAGTVLFGTNEFHPPRLIYDFWLGFAAKNSSSTLSSYSFSESGSDIRPDTDLIEGMFFNEPIWQNGFTFHPVTEVSLVLLVSENSKLSRRRIISEVDLKKYIVVNICRGVSDACDRMHDDLLKAGVRVEEVTIYSTSVILNSLEADKAMIIPECWSSIHPRGKIIPYSCVLQCVYGMGEYGLRTCCTASLFFVVEK